MNGDFWQKLSFGKFIITIIIAVTVQLYAFKYHMDDSNKHLDFKEKTILENIKTKGLYSDEAELNLEKRLAELDKRINQLELRLALYKEEGRLQTPAEKIDLFKRAMHEVLKER